MRPRNFSRLEGVLEDAVSGGVVPGLVALVADESSLLYEGALGRRNAQTDDEMTTDTIFRIASQTKLVTALAVLRLVERGLLTLDTPVGDVLPAFDELQVLEGFADDVPQLRPPTSRATVRQLLTHTSGLAYDIWNADVARFHQVTGMPRLQTGSRASFGVPLVSDPGARFNYGTSMDWAGLIVEALDGRPLEVYWQEELFGPLGLKDTVVELDPSRLPRATPVHARDERGAWVPTGIDFAQKPELYAGGHCLYSTARDFAVIQQVFLNDGRSAAGPLLEPETVDDLFRNHIGDLDVGVIVTADPPASADVDLRGKKWGLGVLVETDDVPGGRAAGSGGWMGGFNSIYWIDRTRSTAAALYAQTIPFCSEEAVDLFRAFETAVYAAVTGD